MSDDQNTTQNPSSTENSIPPSPHPFDSAQDLTERPTPPSHEASGGQGDPAPLNTADSAPVEALPDAPEASGIREVLPQ